MSSGGAKLWTSKGGKGTALLMFNGGPGCSDYLAPVAKLIEDRVTVIRFEPRGCGRSSWDGKYDVETLINDAEQIRQAYDIDEWIVGGHSAGPDFALAYTMKFPARVIGVLGICGGRFVDDRDWHQNYHSNLTHMGEENGGLVFIADEAVNSICNSSWKEYIKRSNVFHDLSQISVPCVFINAENDIRPNWPARQLAELIPEGRYIEIPEAHHYPWLTHRVALRLELQQALDYIGV